MVRKTTVEQNLGPIPMVTMVQMVLMILAFLACVILSGTVMADESGTVDHPELSEQEKLISCADCHKETTPEIQKDWYDSLLRIAMVKCYQCHGTFGEFAVTPTRENCGTCHTGRMKKYTDDKPCWECHTPHSFKVKK